jgi:hypothetical protein
LAERTFFRLTQDRFAALLADHAAPAHLAERLEAPSGATSATTALA